MFRKIYSVPLDLKEPIDGTLFKVKDGDNGNVIIIVLTDNGLPVNLENCAVIAHFSLDNGIISEQSTDDNGVTVSANMITIDLLPSSICPGTVRCELQIYSGEEYETLATTAAFSFTCQHTIMNDDTIQRVPEYTLLHELIQKVQALINGAQSDWTEADRGKQEYIRNKPDKFPPSAHASTHAYGGPDAIEIELTDIEAVGYGATQELTDSEQGIARGNIGAARVIAETVTLTVAGWTGTEAPYSQQLLVNSIPENCQILPAASVGHGEVYGDCEIEATEHELRKITFTCESKPDVAVNVNLLIFY